MATALKLNANSTVDVIMGEASRLALKDVISKGHANDKRRSCVVPISEGVGLVRVHFVSLPSEVPDMISYADEELGDFDCDRY